MTDLLARLAELDGKATPGPWHDFRDAARKLSNGEVDTTLHWVCNMDSPEPGSPAGAGQRGGIAIMWGPHIDEFIGDADTPSTRAEDIELVVALRNAFPAILAYVEAMERQVSALQTHIGYGTQKTWDGVRQTHNEALAARRAVRG